MDLAAPAAQVQGELLATASQFGEGELATARLPDNTAACLGKSAGSAAMRSMLRHDSSRENVGRLATARPDHPGSVEPAAAGLAKPPGSESTSEVSMEPSMCRTGVDLSKYPKNAVTPERRTFHSCLIWFRTLLWSEVFGVECGEHPPSHPCGSV